MTQEQPGGDQATPQTPPTPQKDDFDRLSAAAARVLRSALQGSAAIRAAGDRPEVVLRELERAVAALIREASQAAHDLIEAARELSRGELAPTTNLDQGSAVAAPPRSEALQAPPIVDERVRLTGDRSTERVSAIDPEAKPGDIMIRRRRPRDLGARSAVRGPEPLQTPPAGDAAVRLTRDAPVARVPDEDHETKPDDIIIRRRRPRGS